MPQRQVITEDFLNLPGFLFAEVTIGGTKQVFLKKGEIKDKTDIDLEISSCGATLTTTISVNTAGTVMVYLMGEDTDSSKSKNVTMNFGLYKSL